MLVTKCKNVFDDFQTKLTRDLVYLKYQGREKAIIE